MWPSMGQRSAMQPCVIAIAALHIREGLDNLAAAINPPPFTPEEMVKPLTPDNMEG